MDIKRRAVVLRGQGSSTAEVAERLMISKRSVERCWSHWLEHGELPASARKGKAATRLKGCEEQIEKWVEGKPDVTLDELAGLLKRELGRQASVSTVWRFLRSGGLSCKKTAYAAEQDRPDVAERREIWRGEQGGWDASRLAFVDETGLSPALRLGPQIPAMRGQGSPRALEELHFRRSLDPGGDEGAVAAGRSDGREMLFDLPAHARSRLWSKRWPRSCDRSPSRIAEDSSNTPTMRLAKRNML
jgi:transposase